MGALVVAGVDAASVLQPAEHVFDFVSSAVEGFIVVDLNRLVGL